MRPINAPALLTCIITGVCAISIAPTVCSTSGCAAFVAALPTIGTVISDGMLAIDLVEKAVANYFAAHAAQQAQQAAIDAKIQKVRLALQAGEQALAAIQSATSSDYTAAFADAAAAWGELMQLVAPLGIVSTTPVVAVDAGAPDAGLVHAMVPSLVVHEPQFVKLARHMS